MSDPITLAKQREDADRLPFIAVQEFRTEYKAAPDGRMDPYDVVAWVKKGVQNPSVTEEKISRLSKGQDNMIWQVIEPYYKRWKEGQTAPIDGIPLAAWPGATPQLVKALEPANIRSVEDLSRMEDSAISRIAIPNLRDKQKQARAFLEAQSTVSMSTEMVKLREAVEFLRKENEELRASIEEDTDEPELPKRRGRPPKVQAA